MSPLSLILKYHSSPHPFYHFFLNLADGFCRVKAFGTGVCTVHNGVTAVKLKRVFQIIQAFSCGIVSAIRNPAVGLQKSGGT